MKLTMINFKCHNPKCSKLFVEFVDTFDMTVKHMGNIIPVAKLGCPFCNSRNHQMLIQRRSEHHSDLPAPNVATGAARSRDKVLNHIADSYGLTNMGQPGGTRRGEAVMQIKPPPAAVQPGVKYEPLPGFSVPFTGNAAAGWSEAPAQLRIKAQSHKSVQRSKPIPTFVAGRE